LLGEPIFIGLDKANDLPHEPIQRRELVRTLKTYVSRRSMFPFFFFLSKIVHFLIEIDRDSEVSRNSNWV
jgi:hypothetical protein